MSDENRNTSDENKNQKEADKTPKKDKNKDELNELENNLKKLKETLKNRMGYDQNQKRPDGRRGAGSENNNPWGKSFKTLLIWAVLLLIGLLLFDYFGKDKIYEFKTINEFREYKDKITSIEITPSLTLSKIKGQFKSPVKIKNKQFPSSEKEYIGFRLNYPTLNLEDTKKWEKEGIKVSLKEEGYGIGSILLNILPWIIFIAIWIFLIRRMQGGQNGGKGIFNFGKSKARLIDEKSKKTTFDDVAGAKEAKEELKEIIDFLKAPEKFTDIGAKIPRGVLLTGPPGTGKTLLSKAVAGEAGVPFYSMSGADFVEMFVGVGASRVRDLFEQGKKAAPCILFIDELDAVGRHRGTGIGGGNDEREQTLNQLLVEMDGFDTNDSVIVVAATNRPDVLDPALLRPGRFDRNIIVDRPDVKAREAILKVHAKKVKSSGELDFETIAKGTPGMSGAELANIINEAALLAARRNSKVVEILDIEEAKDKVMMGPERKSAAINEKEKEITAYHEAGHVLIAKFTEDSDPIHKVTIIPRGMAMGVTHYLPMDERHSYSKKYIMSKLHHLFGGRVAEEIIYGDITTGASNDIERASDLARKMVCEWGMSEEVGPIHYGVKNDNPFLGKELTRTQSISEEIGKKIDSAVQSIIFKALERTRSIISENIDMLHAISKELLKKETLTGAEIDKILGICEETRENDANLNQA